MSYDRELPGLLESCPSLPSFPFLLNCHDSDDDEYVEGWATKDIYSPCITPDTSKRQLFAEGKEGGGKDKQSV